MITRTPNSVAGLQVKRCWHGRGVFTPVRIAPREEILTFQGSVLRRDALPSPLLPEEDYYLQIEEDLFMGPSGEADDLVNHSCEPNTGIMSRNGEWILVAISPIEPADELSFDYSTTMSRAPCELDCACGAGQCRGRVRDFCTLPWTLQEYYVRLGIVLEHACRTRSRP